MPQPIITPFLTGLVVFICNSKNMDCIQLAKSLQKEYNYIWKIINGTKNPSPQYIDRIFHKNNITVPQFLEYTTAYILSLQTSVNAPATVPNTPIPATKLKHKKPNSKKSKPNI